MGDDLKLTGIQYNIALSIFFIPYILLEVPSNVLLKKFKRPSTYIGILVVSWGIVMTCTGLIKDFAGLMVCRVFLGVSSVAYSRSVTSHC
jgi:MFS family permease